MLYFYFLVGFAFALGLLARFGGVYPRPKVIVVFAIPTLLALWIIPLPIIWPLVAIIDGVIALVAIADIFTCARERAFEVQRKVGPIASLGKQHKVRLTVNNRSNRMLVVDLKDGVPNGFEAEPAEFELELTPRSRSSVSYQLKSFKRGEFKLKDIYVRATSRLGLWRRQLKLPCESTVHVYPDMQQLGEYALLARSNRLSMMGMRRTRRVGQDNEFERLRDYTPDDNYRHIDWRTTARRNKLTVKDFQANQSQRIIFLIDCGRMMTGEAAGMSLLDHAFNAMLMMSFVALRQNDQVGLMCFSDEMHTFVPPKGGASQMNRLLHATYNQFPQVVESRYDDAFLHLSSHVRKRALVVLITNVVDEVNARQIKRRLSSLTGRHLPLAVLLRDHALFDAIEPVDQMLARGAVLPHPYHSAEEASHPTIALEDPQLYQAAAAAQMLTWRRQVIAGLEASGVLLVDSFPEQLTAPLVNRYLDIKASHLL